MSRRRRQSRQMSPRPSTGSGPGARHQRSRDLDPPTSPARALPQRRPVVHRTGSAPTRRGRGYGGVPRILIYHPLPRRASSQSPLSFTAWGVQPALSLLNGRCAFAGGMGMSTGFATITFARRGVQRGEAPLPGARGCPRLLLYHPRPRRASSQSPLSFTGRGVQPALSLLKGLIRLRRWDGDVPGLCHYHVCPTGCERGEAPLPGARGCPPSLALSPPSPESVVSKPPIVHSTGSAACLEPVERTDTPSPVGWGCPRALPLSRLPNGV